MTEPAGHTVVMRRRSMADGLTGLRLIPLPFYAANRNVTDAGTLGEITAERSCGGHVPIADMMACRPRPMS